MAAAVARERTSAAATANAKHAAGAATGIMVKKAFQARRSVKICFCKQIIQHFAALVRLYL